MSPAIRKLYAFHFFSSVALTVMASNLLTSNVMLRAGLDMSQYGLIWGVAMFLPALVNLLLAPVILHLQLDRLVVAAAPLGRVLLSFGYLILPPLIVDRGTLTAALAVLTVAWMIFPLLSTNSLMVLCNAYIPPQALGRHSSVMLVLWELPMRVLSIPAGWYIDRHSGGSDAEFYQATFWALLLTASFQLLGTWVILTLREPSVVDPESSAATENGGVGWAALLDPFRDGEFRRFMNVELAANVLLAMIGTFMFPYVRDALGWSLSGISTLELVLSLLGVLLIPLWGALADRHGGKRIFRTCAFGVAASLPLLAWGGPLLVVVFAALAWQGLNGLFGTGLQVGQRYLLLSESRNGQSNIFIAAAGLVGGAGYLVGSVGGGVLIQWLKSRVDPANPHGHYPIFFAVCALGFLLLAQLVGAMRDTHRRISSVALGRDLLRTLWQFGTRSM